MWEVSAGTRLTKFTQNVNAGLVEDIAFLEVQVCDKEECDKATFLLSPSYNCYTETLKDKS